MSNEGRDSTAPEKPASGPDAKLIEASGLKVTEIGNILGRSRQAIYQGLSSKEGYFGAGELVAIVNTLIASDSPRIDSVCALIESNYPNNVSDLVLPDRVSLAQLEHAAESCERLVFVFSGDTEHARQKSLFIQAFSWAHDVHLAKLSLVTANTWFQGLLTDQYGLGGAYSHITSDQYQHPLSFVLIKGGRQPTRLFYFGKRRKS